MKEITKDLIIKHAGPVDLAQVEYLRIVQDKITKIRSLDILPSLKILILSHNLITELEGLAKCSEIREINLANNKITGVSSFAFDSCKFLLNLDLSNNLIEVFTSSTSMQRLQKLILNHNNITDLSFLSNLVNLRVLDISHNNIKKLDQVNYLTKLEEFYASNNKVAAISEKIFTNNGNLITLDLSGNELKSMSFAQNIPNLMVLKLANNRIENIDLQKKNIFFENLDISNNQIKSLLKIPQVFPNIVILNISNNENLASFEVYILDELDELREIYYEGNYFCTSTLDDEIHKSYPFLEIINGKQVQPIGYKELQEIQEIKTKGDVSMSESEWTDISSQISDGDELEQLKKNVFMKAAQSRREEGLLANKESYSSFISDYQMQMFKLKCIHQAINGKDSDDEGDNYDQKESESKNSKKTNLEIINEQSPTKSKNDESFSTVNDSESNEEYKNERLLITQTKSTPSKNIMIRTQKSQISVPKGKQSTSDLERNMTRTTATSFRRASSRGFDRTSSITAEEVEDNLIKNKENFSQLKDKYKQLNYKDLIKSKPNKKISEAIKMSKTIETKKT